MAIAVFRPVPRPIQPARRILPPAPPAFPVVQATNTSQNDTNATEHTVALPTGINAGDLLLVAFSCHGNRTVSWPGGWVEIFELGQAGGNTATLAVAYRQADGGEGGTITVTTSGSEKSAHCSWRITGHEDPGTQAPEASTGATESADWKPDPDSLTPTGGSKNYLWLAVAGWSGFTFGGTYPGSYTGGMYIDASNWDEAGIAGAQRNLAAASEDPSNFTISSSTAWVACTVGVHPYSGAAPPAAIGPPVGSQVI